MPRILHLLAGTAVAASLFLALLPEALHGKPASSLIATILQGRPGTAMPPFEGQLSETDRWHAVNYIRGFAPSAE